MEYCKVQLRITVWFPVCSNIIYQVMDLEAADLKLHTGHILPVETERSCEVSQVYSQTRQEQNTTDTTTDLFHYKYIQFITVFVVMFIHKHVSNKDIHSAQITNALVRNSFTRLQDSL